MTLQLPEKVIAYITAQRALFQRQHEQLAESEAEFEGVVMELNAVAGTIDDKLTITANPIKPGVDEFGKLPWKTNSKGEWMFADKPEAKPIIAKIGTAKGTRWIDGGYEYYVSVSKDGTRFLNRNRAK